MARYPAAGVRIERSGELLNDDSGTIHDLLERIPAAARNIQK
jgi:hypothetical protein